MNPYQGPSTNYASNRERVIQAIGELRQDPKMVERWGHSLTDYYDRVLSSMTDTVDTSDSPDLQIMVSHQ